MDALLRQHRAFVADTSHELRNPLLALRTNLDVLERIDDPALRHECLVEARAQSERMTRLVSDLLLLARAEAGADRRPRCVAHPVQQFAESAQACIEERTLWVGPLAAVLVRGDAGRLTQVLTNLVSNAVEHTAPTGHD